MTYEKLTSVEKLAYMQALRDASKVAQAHLTYLLESSERQEFDEARRNRFGYRSEGALEVLQLINMMAEDVASQRPKVKNLQHE